MDHPTLRILYTSVESDANIRRSSGAPYFITRALKARGCQLSLAQHFQLPRLTLNKAYNKVLSFTGFTLRMPLERSQEIARRMAADVARQAEGADVDLVFSTSSIPLALLQTRHPKAFYTDCTFNDLLETYPELANYPEQWKEEGHALEQAALQNCDLAIYSSEWAARSAVGYYGADPRKVKVVPYGSNFEAHPSREVVLDAIRARAGKRCELLLVGVNWERKGGPLAWEVARDLNLAGIDTRLTVLGCTPPPELKAPFMRVMKFIGKDTLQGQQEIMRLMLDAHFLLVPSTAECFGFVYAEASAMGLPSLARDVGGVGSAVRNGQNGFLFPADAPARVYVERIRELLANPAAYAQLARSSHDEFTNILNWETAGTALCELLGELRS